MEIAAFRHWNTETNEVQYDVPAQLIRRPPQFNSSGKGVVVGINSYPITQFPTQTVYQYDVSYANVRMGSTNSNTLDLYPCISVSVLIRARRFTSEPGSRSVA